MLSHQDPGCVEGSSLHKTLIPIASALTAETPRRARGRFACGSTHSFSPSESVGESSDRRVSEFAESERTAVPLSRDESAETGLSCSATDCWAKTGPGISRPPARRPAIEARLKGNIGQKWQLRCNGETPGRTRVLPRSHTGSRPRRRPPRQTHPHHRFRVRSACRPEAAGRRS
jgi:hypothetical protein